MLLGKKRFAGVFAAALVVGALGVMPAQATIQVSFSPANQVVLIADGTATVDIVAVIPEADAIVAWGFDLGVLGTSVSVDSVSVNEPTWTATTGADGDPFAGLVPAPPGTAIWSDPVAIVLATVTFSLDSLGLTGLAMGDDNPTDLSEGFALDPPPVGAFADVEYGAGSITVVVPEPLSVALLALGGMACVSRRQR